MKSQKLFERTTWLRVAIVKDQVNKAAIESAKSLALIIINFIGNINTNSHVNEQKRFFFDFQHCK